jgi:hypothetical protein
MRRTGSTLGLVALLGCDGSLPSPARVDSLRVLALPTDTPTLRPGLNPTVRAVWFDPSPDRPRTFTWRLCAETEGFDPRDCARSAVGETLSQGAPDLVRVPATSLQTAGRYVVWVLLCPGAEAPDPTAETLRCPTDEGFEAFRRLTVAPEGPLHPPPRIAAWTLSRGDRSVALTDDRPTVPANTPCAGDCPAWTVTVTADPAQLHPEARLLVSFLGTTGTYSRPRDALADATLRPLTAGYVPGRVPGEARLWVVLRDQQGGEDVREARVRFE